MATTDPLPKPSSDSCSAVELSIAQERLRQAHHSFNLALVMTAACALISLAGVIFLFLGKGPEGTITAIAGLTSTVRCLELAKDTNDRLDKVALEIKSEA
ncbi:MULTISPECIES: hypothetical protein [Trichocoleus]|uniref:Cyanobacterial TRADD-N associated 2 transmembrane domain-containing protein n=1 Tax=Trichocoleus desertorum GB2-A4 TaxID=2933944 RepID=A0ABV0JE13_9CYAN|nr:hypothetical protein [Trichocoleus sp. FACHB-46]MBD1865203.1 hypothetical protein [Trichocoleus sp. FACHB-46]